MYQICTITAAAKKALKEKSSLSYTPLKYENRIEFQFLLEQKLFSTKKYIAENVSVWYDYCFKKGLQDIKFLSPITVKDRGILGFSNTTESSITCFYKGGKVTYFSAQWEFDSVKKCGIFFILNMSGMMRLLIGHSLKIIQKVSNLFY